MRNAWHILWRQIRSRSRLRTAALIGLLIGAFLPPNFAMSTRLLIAWDVSIVLYLVLMLWMFHRATPTIMRARAIQLDEGAWVMLFIIVVAAIASIAAIVMELSDIKSVPRIERLTHLTLGITTITCSWAFVHTNFAVHYAHEYYICLKESGRAALEFPQSQDHEPDYWDFMYFSFVVGMTSQTSDVQIAAPGLRRLALLHGVIAFFFNATLLALAVNTAAGVL